MKITQKIVWSVLVIVLGVLCLIMKRDVITVAMTLLGALLIAYGALAFCFKKGVVKGAFFARIYPFIK